MDLVESLETFENEAATEQQEEEENTELREIRNTDEFGTPGENSLVLTTEDDENEYLSANNASIDSSSEDGILETQPPEFAVSPASTVTGSPLITWSPPSSPANSRQDATETGTLFSNAPLMPTIGVVSSSLNLDDSSIYSPPLTRSMSKKVKEEEKK